MANVRIQVPSGEAIDVAVEREGSDAQQYTCRLPDRTLPVTLAPHDPDRGFLIHNHQVKRYVVLRRNDSVEVWINGQAHRLVLPSRTARRHGSSDQAAPVGDIVAAMPGTILKIEVAAGDRFAAHQPLVIMESMKMEMTLSSPSAGRIKEISCRAGQLVDIGAVLIRVEPDSA